MTSSIWVSIILTVGMVRSASGESWARQFPRILNEMQASEGPMSDSFLDSNSACEVESTSTSSCVYLADCTACAKKCFPNPPVADLEVNMNLKMEAHTNETAFCSMLGSLYSAQSGSMMLSGCPTSTEFGSAFDAAEFSTMLEAMAASEDSDLPEVPFTSLDEAKTFLSSTCVNATVPNMEGICVSKGINDLMLAILPCMEVAESADAVCDPYAMMSNSTCITAIGEIIGLSKGSAEDIASLLSEFHTACQALTSMETCESYDGNKYTDALTKAKSGASLLSMGPLVFAGVLVLTSLLL